MAMYADLVERDRTIDAKTLSTYQDPGLQAAIDRVVDRVDDPRVRWLLRYGVVPRRLEFDFVVRVMWPSLNSGMSGAWSMDDVRVDPPVTAEKFPIGLDPLESEPQLYSLWENLLNYAADYSWVMADEDGLSVRFRSDLIQPLRQLISQKPVFVELQNAAVAYFDSKASDSSAEWSRWSREAIFHRLQLDIDDGAQAWHTAISEARAGGREDWCLELATDLLGSDFVDDRTGAPLVGVMNPQLLAEAHLQRAAAAAALAEQKAGRTTHGVMESAVAADSDPLWVDVDEGLTAARALARQYPDVSLPDQDLLVLDGRLANARGQYRSVVASLREHRKLVDETTSSADELAVLDRTLGQAMTAVGEPAGAAYLESSYERAKDLEDPSAARLSALYRTSWLIESSQCDEAVRVLREAEVDSSIDPQDPDVISLWSWVYDELGYPHRSIDHARRLPDGDRRQVETHLVMSGSLCDLGMPVEALNELDLARRAAPIDPDAPTDHMVRCLAMEGLCRALLHQSQLAAECLLAAAAHARELRDLNQAAYMAAVAGLVHMSVGGSLREAEQAIDEAARAGADEGSQGWTMVRVVKALLLRRVDRADDADDLLHRSLDVLRAHSAVPKLRIQIASGGLIVAPTNLLWAEELIHQLHAVSPAAARITKMNWASEMSGSVAPEARERLLSVTLGSVQEPELSRTPAEWVQHVHRVAAVLRIAGEKARAREFLISVAAHQHNIFEWFAWLEEMGRLGPAATDDPVPPEEVLDDEWPVTASVLLTLARRRLTLDGIDATIARLDRAERILASQVEVNGRSAEMALARAEVSRICGERHAAARYASHAARAYELLGDFVTRNEVATNFELGTRDRTPDAESVQIRFGQPQDGRIQVLMRLPDGGELSGESLPEIFDQESQNDVLRRIRTVFGPLLDGWRNWSTQIAEKILPPTIAAALAPDAGQHRDLRLVFGSSDVAAMPWELCQAWDSGVPLAQHPAMHDLYRSIRSQRRNEMRIRILQEALRHLELFQGVPDGLVGGHTAAVLKAFQQDSGVQEQGPGRATFEALRNELAGGRRPLRVLLVRPDPHAQLERQRGDLAIGAGLVGIYNAQGADIEQLDLTGSSSRRVAMSRAHGFRPDVVHITASIRYAGGAVMLDLGGDAAYRSLSRTGAGWDGLTVSDLNALLVTASAGRTVPLAIIDVPAAASLTETVRACGGRNSFAHQLLGVGGAQAVLATGLAEPRAQIEILHTIVARLTVGDLISDIVRGLHRTQLAGGMDTHAMLAFAGMALFLERPPYSLFPVWAL